MPRSRLAACTHCRDSHIRCDRLTPKCTNCRKSKPPKKCILDRLEIKESNYTVKVRTSDGARNASISRPPHAKGSVDLPAQQLLMTNNIDSLARSGGTLEHTDSLLCSISTLRGHQPDNSPLAAGRSPKSLILATSPSLFSRDDAPLESSYLESVSTFNAIASPPSPAVTSSRREPETDTRRNVTDFTEQYVFEFYINYAGPWIDIVSPQNHFAKTISRKALKEPVLYYACLAYASMILHLNEGLDKSIHDDYQSRAITIFIPLLSNCVTGANTDLLATTVLLRMAEQFTETTEDAGHHLQGAWSVFSSVQEKWSPAMTDLRGAAFWIYLRQSIRASFLNEQGCRFNLDHVDVEGFAVATSEEIWTNQVTYLLARLCDGCWGDCTSEKKEITRKKVSLELDEWYAGIPNAFQPWSFSHAESQAFPVVKYLSPWHEIAWQKYYTSRVMLAAYGSDHPGPGSNMLEINRYLEAEIIRPAKMACGVVFSSPHIGSHLNGCHLVAWCGQFFTGKEEQRTLSAFLQDFTNRTHWPNRTCHERLQEIWKGNQKTWTGR